MLERTIWSDLIEWKSRNHHPLIVRGLRQVGKTFIVREFGKAFYDNVVYLDLRANIPLHIPAFLQVACEYHLFQ